jgi:tripartite ATP-independent transporter DctP family solute receptor
MEQQKMNSIFRTLLSCIATRSCTALVAGTLMLAGGVAHAQAKHTLHLGHNLAADHPINVTAVELSKAVAARTNGAVDIKVYPSAQLAGLREGTEGVRLGTVDMYWSDSGMVGSLLPSVAFVSLPFLFTTHDQAILAMDTLRPKLDQVFRERLGVERLSWSPNGFRVIVTKGRAIKSAADLRGLKIRVPEIPLYVDTFKTLQTNATPLAWGEVYTSLQSGVIEGVEGPSGAIDTSKFAEVATDVSRTNHIMTDVNLLVNKKRFDALPKEYQAILREEADRITSKGLQKLVRSFEDEAYGNLKRKLKAIDEPDVTSFRTTARPVWDRFVAKNPESRAWIDAVQAVKN